MNIKELSENVELDEETYIELLTLFHETTLSDLKKIDSALREGSAGRVADAAHSIKGAASSLGIIDMYEAAKEVEIKGRQNMLDSIEEAISLLKEKISGMEAVLP